MTENQIVLLDGRGQSEITVAAGDHQLDVTVNQSSGATTFNTDKFTINRGGRKVIEVQEELAKAVASRESTVPKLPQFGSCALIAKDHTPQTSPSDTVDRRAAHWVLSLGGSATLREGREAKPFLIELRA